MKNAFITLAGLALLAGAPATVRAQDADLDTRLNQAWSDLNDKWLSGKIGDREFQNVTDILIKVTEASKAVYPDAGTVRYRLTAAVDDLHTRANQAMKQGQYVDTVWEQIVDFRLNRALAILKATLGTRPGAEADFIAVSDEMTKRAEAAKDNPRSAASVLAALRARVAELQAKAAKGALGAGEFKALEMDLAEDRLGRTAYWLRQRAIVAARATHYDFVRLTETTRDRAAAAATANDTLAAYLREIDRLEALAGNNTINQDEFDKMVAALNIRAGYSKS